MSRVPRFSLISETEIQLPSSRRTFLQHAAALAVSTSLRQSGHPAESSAPLHVLELTPFVDELPLPQRIAAPAHGPLRVTMREIHAKVHRDIPPTRMWSYGSTALSPLIEARSHRPLEVEWVNQLPRRHFLPIDYTLHGCGHDIPEVRACVHLHGGRTPSPHDGLPDDWFVPGQSRICRYPLQQDAATLWYHDHAMGINRLNIYAGLAGMLLVRDAEEERLRLPAGKYEIPLTLYDRDFTVDGQLAYPVSGIAGKPWVPEFTADAILVNGKIRPFVQVEPRLYRLRVLNASNSRFFLLSVATPEVDGTPAARNSRERHPIDQIGTDQGLLGSPVRLTQLSLAPGERADLLIDFSQFAGKRLHLCNTALDIVEFRVADAQPTPARALPATLRHLPAPAPANATVTRTITLNEYQDRVGRSMVMLLNRKHWHEPVTETPKLNATEIWEFVNLTEDTHPMHLHMVRFRILDRRTFDTAAYLANKSIHFLAPPTPPEEHEAGWKDVVQCPADQITRILVTFDGYPGRYLYHCHILEHESNDMMRPFEVLPA
jgi:spore coat protein A